MASRSSVPDEQKSFIKFMHLYLQMSAKEIRDHRSMLRPDGTKHRLDTIQRWISRFEETGSMDAKPRTGRPPKMSPTASSDLINKVLSNPKERYPAIKRLSPDAIRLDVSVRTINRMANKNGIRKWNHTEKLFSRSLFSERLSEKRFQRV